MSEHTAENDALRHKLHNALGGYRVAAEAADRFRDVLAEALGYADENPGDDVLIRDLRAHFMKGIMTVKGHKVPKRRRTRVEARTPAEIVVVSAAQYKRLTAPDRPSEVPRALRQLVLQGRSSTSAR